MADWYYRRGGIEYGPLKVGQLLQLKMRGRLPDDVMVREGEHGKWLPVSEVPIESSAPGSMESPSLSATIPEAAGDHRLHGKPAKLPFFLKLMTLAAIMALVLKGVETLWIAYGYLGILQPQAALSYFRDEASRFSLNGSFDQWKYGTLLAVSFLVMVWHATAFVTLRKRFHFQTQHSAWSCLWWLAPIANLILPYLCLREIEAWALHGRRSRAHAPIASPLLFGWQMIWVATSMMIVVTGYRRMYVLSFLKGEIVLDVGMYSGLAWLMAGENLLLAIQALMLAAILFRIARLLGKQCLPIVHQVSQSSKSS